MPGAPKDIVDKPGNKTCADCGASGPRWASVNLGVLLCTDCAGVHRGLGVHITVVKSTKIDDWKPEWITTVRGIGNEIGNAYYEHSAPPGAKYKANPNLVGGDKLDTSEAKKAEAWIRDKYEHKRYAPPGVEEPYKRLKKGEVLTADAGTPVAETVDDDRKHHKKSKKDKSEKKDKKGDKENDSSPFGEAADSFAALGAWAAEASGDAKARKQKHSKRDASSSRHTKRDGSSSKRDGSSSRHRKHSNHDGFSEATVTPANTSPGAPMAWQQNSYGETYQFYGQDQHQQDHQMQQQQVQMQMQMQMQAQQHMQEQMQHQVQQQHQQQQQMQQQQQQMYQMQQGQLQQQQLEHGSQQQQMQQQQMQQQPQQQMNQHLPQMQQFDQQQQRTDYHNYGPQANGRDPQYWGGRGSPEPPQFSFGRNESLPGGPLAPAPAGMNTNASDGAYIASSPSVERRSALMSIAKLFRAPESVGVTRDTVLVRPSGFDIQTAEFDPSTALVKRRGIGDTSSRAGSHHPDPSSWFEEVAPASTSWRATSEKKTSFGADSGRGWGPARPKIVAAAPVVAATVEKEQLAKAVGESVGASIGQLAEELRRMRDDISRAASPPLTLGHDSVQSGAPASTAAALVSALSRGSCGGNLVGASSPDWDLSDIDAQSIRQYADLFWKTDGNCDGWVEGVEARIVLDRSALPPKDLAHIWGLVDQGCEGRLGLDAFVCALQLVKWRLAGGALPPQLPDGLAYRVAELTATLQRGAPPAPVLLPSTAVRSEPVPDPEGFVTTASRDVWVPDSAQLEGYCALFKQIVPCDQELLGPELARQVLLERSGLPLQDLSHIWNLSDFNADCNLSLGEFVCAMHLSFLRGQGHALPPSVPTTLAEVCATLGSTHGPGGANSAPWAILPEQFAVYRGCLEQMSRSQADFVSASEAKPVLEGFGLPPADLWQIWQITDIDGDGQLSLCEFVCALHLTELRRLAHLSELPQSLPAELAACAARLLDAPSPVAAASAPSSTTPGQQAPAGVDPWAVTEEELDSYWTIFRETCRTEPGRVMVAEEAKLLLERSQLPVSELGNIWNLSDWDCDGCLSPAETFCALHLANRRQRGVPLPDKPPADLVRRCEAAALRRCDGGAGNVGSVGSIDGATAHADWSLDTSALAKYRMLFAEHAKQQPNLMGAEEARVLLRRSNLPDSQLMKVWELCDVNVDGALSFPEFACAMHLVSLCRQGRSLPSELPQELASSSGLQPPAGASDDGGIWAVGEAELRQAREIFDRVADKSGAVGAEAGKVIFERSGLPQEDLTHIWQLSDVDRNTSLGFGEFACAMHLLARRRQGLQLPSVLPLELEDLARSPGGRPANS